MKRLLLLFIPLIFFFGCEEKNISYNCIDDGSGTCVESANGYFLNLEDCETYCMCEPNCGIVVDLSYFPASVETFTGFDTDGDGIDDYWASNNDGHGAYTIYYIENYCSGNIGTTCYTLSGLNIGDSFCMDIQSDWIESVVFNPLTGQVELQTGCFSTNVPFE